MHKMNLIMVGYQASSIFLSDLSVANPRVIAPTWQNMYLVSLHLQIKKDVVKIQSNNVYMIHI